MSQNAQRNRRISDRLTAAQIAKEIAEGELDEALRNTREQADTLIHGSGRYRAPAPTDPHGAG